MDTNVWQPTEEKGLHSTQLLNEDFPGEGQQDEGTCDPDFPEDRRGAREAVIKVVLLLLLFLRHLTLNSNLLFSLGGPSTPDHLGITGVHYYSQLGCCVSCQNLSSGEATLYVKFLLSLSFGNRYLPPLLGKQTPCEISLSFTILGLCLNGLVWVCSKSCLRWWW